MPRMPLHPCNKPGCKVLTRGRFCDAHNPGPWHREKEPERLRGRALQEARAELFRRQPLCVICFRLGITRAATERDHIIPLARGGKDTAQNTQALCKTCHNKKSAKEAVRAWRSS